MKKYLYLFSMLSLLLFSFILSDVYTSQEERIFRSQTLPQDFAFDYPHAFREIYIRTGPQSTLHGLHFPSKTSSSKGAVLYFHGRAWNLGAKKRTGIPEDFITRGYDLFVIDYRGFGKSTGSRSEKAIHEDANCAYNYLKQRFPEGQITVYGMSFGTGVATCVAARHNPKQLILECPYYSMLDMADKALPYLPNFLTSLILKYHLRTDTHIQKVTCPIHIFHGTQDKLIPYSSSKKLLQNIRSNVHARLISVENGDHDHLPSFKTYRKELDKILH